VNIEKSDGGIRPLGVPALEDKIVQKAVVTILEAVYEVDFHPHSYGFRRGRSAHDALNRLNELFFRGQVRWVIDADIKAYFDTVVHKHLMEFVSRRIVDGSLLRLISKWLHAGVLADGQLLPTDVGTPQGSVASPLLANVYLHYVLDEWWQQVVLPRMRGRAELIRYADDFVLGFECKEDAERVYRILGQRFERYGLTLHPEKTRLIHFDKQQARRDRLDGSKPPTFDFLGFTHYFGKSLRGHLTYRVRTMAKRLRRTITALGDWCRVNRHRPLEQQWQILCAKLRGHYEYYGRSQNMRRLDQVYRASLRLWYKWLSRRHGRKPLSWQRFQLIKARFPLTRPHITHTLF
jgi:group II intron reverse transcriptase/maturase